MAKENRYVANLCMIGIGYSLLNFFER